MSESPKKKKRRIIEDSSSEDEEDATNTHRIFSPTASPQTTPEPSNQNWYWAYSNPPSPYFQYDDGIVIPSPPDTTPPRPSDHMTTSPPPPSPMNTSTSYNTPSPIHAPSPIHRLTPLPTQAPAPPPIRHPIPLPLRDPTPSPRHDPTPSSSQSSPYPISPTTSSVTTSTTTATTTPAATAGTYDLPIDLDDFDELETPSHQATAPPPHNTQRGGRQPLARGAKTKAQNAASKGISGSKSIPGNKSIPVSQAPNARASTSENITIVKTCNEYEGYKSGDCVRVTPRTKGRWVPYCNQQFMKLLKPAPDNKEEDVHEYWLARIVQFVQESDGEWSAEVQYFYRPSDAFIFFKEGLHPKRLFLVEKNELHSMDLVVSKCEVKHRRAIAQFEDWITAEDNFYYEDVYSDKLYFFLTPTQYVEPQLDPTIEKTNLDLFSGAGALGEGFRKAGLPMHDAVEIDKNAAKTHRGFHKNTNMHEMDVNEFNRKICYVHGIKYKRKWTIFAADISRLEGLDLCDENASDEYDVERIVASRRVQGKKQYLLKWEGWPMDDNDWVDASEILRGGESLIKNYKRDKELKKEADKLKEKTVEEQEEGETNNRKRAKKNDEVKQAKSGCQQNGCANTQSNANPRRTNYNTTDNEVIDLTTDSEDDSNDKGAEEFGEDKRKDALKGKNENKRKNAHKSRDEDKRKDADKRYDEDDDFVTEKPRYNCYKTKLREKEL